MQVSINALESNQCRDIVNSAIDNWLKQKPRKKVKKATVRTQSENALEGVEKEPQGGKLFLEGDAEGEKEEEEEAGPATPDQSVSTDLEASAEEEAAVVASTTGLPDPDYDSATESDCESDHDYQ